ncbi:glycogen debranching protein [Aureisphaera galaxeae]|uniref:alpha-L-rhamnosidase-related protein n=1 Tax=Aureisphaera galaxeae TaxID=1538023 RepID=UPI00234FC438|nr:glycogen debranching protein [Aureisphaera galaxeae]MDC8003463.1 glycogen debranching protein [Aureisphaera galaxeae]
MKKAFLLICLLPFISCQNSEEKPLSFAELSEGSPSITGKESYLESPYVTAGDRVYIVGHQDGSFPDLGWHIKGEMGGIWNHPIKLMDGFEISLQLEDSNHVLKKADSFSNYPYANKMNYSLNEDLSVERWQFVPDGKEGVVIQLHITNRGSKGKGVVNFTAQSDLRPTWLGERTQMIDGPDLASYDSTKGLLTFKDSLNPWYSIIGMDARVTGYSEAEKEASASNAKTLSYEIELPENGSTLVNFVIAGSYLSEESALENHRSIRQNLYNDFTAKKERYEALSEKTKLTVPDKDIEEAFEWVKYNCDWLVRTVPEIGTGIGAGIPDYPWWFGVDSEYALQGYMAIGQRDPVYSTIKLLDSVSEAVNSNGRIIHEMSTNGAVFNPGNINETPQFATLIWKIYQWNGDKAFLEKYFPTIEKGLNWLMNENDADKNQFPDGYGMMEVHGMDSEMIDVAAYTQKAFADASKIAAEIGKDGLSKGYAYIAEQIKGKINEQFWSEEFNSYADFIGSDEQALHLIEDAIVRADTLGKPWAVEELKQTREAILANPSSESRPFVMHHNWVVNTPMEVGIAPEDKAIKALNTAEKFVNPFGVFVTGIDRDESAGSDDGSFQGSKVFSYTGAVMTLPTGVQIVSENNYGRPDKALNYMKRMTRTFSYALPGSIYEVSPDYGMVTQAWNIYGYAVPIVEQFFGIQPDAANKKVFIKPQMPSSWDDAALENVQVGDNEISVYFTNKNGVTEVRVTQTQDDWEIVVQLPKVEGSSFSVDGTRISSEVSPSYYRISSEQKEAALIVKQK